MTVNAQSTSFAQRFQFLLDAVRHESGREYNLTEIAEAINATGHQISRGYLSALKEGKKPQPSPDVVDAIGSFFGVPPAYFYDDDTARWVESEIRLVSSLRATGVRHISLEAVGLSQPSLDILAETIRHLRKLEGLPESSDAPAPKRRRRWRKRDEATAAGPTQEAAAPGS